VRNRGAGSSGAERPSANPSRDAQVGVAIVSWNVRDLLLRCLETVLADPAVGAVVVVDNASTDGTVEAVRERFPAVILIANPDNRGFAAANNQAFAALGDRLPYVFILNPDTELVGASSEASSGSPCGALIKQLEAFPFAAGVGPRLRYGDGSVQSSRRRFPTLAVALTESTPIEWHWPDHAIARRYRMDDVPDDEAQTVDWLNGAAILFRQEALAEVGGFDEGYFMYSEELDLCRRLADAGWSMRFEPEAEVLHFEGRSSEQVVCARHLRFMRSRVRYVRRFMGPVASNVVRFAVRLMYVVEWGIETLKWAVGHRRELRRERMGCYARVLREL
jgi:GT2 family glycosyltransferase